jgi:hypothetical protein
MTTMFRVLWVEVASEAPAISLTDRGFLVVWRDEFPISYGLVTSVVGAGFRSSIGALAEPRRALAVAAADRCFLAAWRWDRAGAHSVLSEAEAHALWRRELAAATHVLEAAERYAAPSKPFAIDPTAQAFAAAAAARHLPPLAPPQALSMPDAGTLAVQTATLLSSGAPPYLIDLGLAWLGRLGALRDGTAVDAAPAVDASAPLAERLERQLARADLSPTLRAQLKVVRIPTEPAAFGTAYDRPVHPRESDDLLVRGRTWGELETEFREALAALKEALQ